MQTKGQGQSGRKRISVAMAVYNGEAYLKEQLDSILQQLQKNDELVISDDGSTDCTLDIVRAYAATDKRIQILRGLAGASSKILPMRSRIRAARIFSSQIRMMYGSRKR